MGGLHSVANLKKVYSGLVELGIITKELAVEKKPVISAFDNALNLLDLVKSGINVKEMVLEGMEMDSEDKMEFANHVGIDTQKLGLPEVSKKVNEALFLMYEGVERVAGDIQYAEKVVAFVKSL